MAIMKLNDGQLQFLVIHVCDGDPHYCIRDIYSLLMLPFSTRICRRSVLKHYLFPNLSYINIS